MTDQPVPNTTATTTTSTPESRKSIRDKIFGAKPLEVPVTFMGTQVYLRQPPLGEVLEFREIGTDQKEQTVRMIIRYTFVPGTDERVFEDADFESILNLPFGQDFLRLSTAMNKLTAQDEETMKEALDDATKSTEE